MRSSILSIGTELLFGQIVNTNTVFLSQELNLLGIDVVSHHTIGDNPKRLAHTLELALEESDLIITTGGLGPTQDDMTKEIVSKVFEDTIIPHEESLERLKNHFIKMNREMSENNLKQGHLPSRAKVFDNSVGTAPGFALEHQGKRIICLPGPPVEMKTMFRDHARPYLETMTNSSIYYKVIRLFGIGESMLETKILDLVESQRDPTLATYATVGECSLRIASKREDLNEAIEAVDSMIKEIEKYVGEYIYSKDDEDLYQVVSKKLMDKNISISVAESCTGGMFSQTLSSVSGISKVFDRGIVTYSNKAKMEELNVQESTLISYGAVSKETAIEMAKGIKEASQTRIAIAITGIAGPTGGTEEKPVGLIHICLIFDDQIISKEFRMRNVNRNWNRNYATLVMFDMVNRILDGKEQLA